MNLGVQRFHAAVEHFRKAGEVGDVADVEPGLAKRASGAAGRDEFNPVLGEVAGEVDQPGLIRNAQECTTNLLVPRQSRSPASFLDEVKGNCKQSRRRCHAGQVKAVRRLSSGEGQDSFNVWIPEARTVAILTVRLRINPRSCLRWSPASPTRGSLENLRRRAGRVRGGRWPRRPMCWWGSTAPCFCR